MPGVAFANHQGWDGSPPRQKLALAKMLLESAETSLDPDAETVWDTEISDRIKAIDSGRITGVSYEEVLRVAEERLGQ